MMTADIIAVSIVFLCLLLVLSGALKWLLRIGAGILLGVVILICLGFLADNPRFHELSKGFLKDGTIIHCVKSQVVSIIRGPHKVSEKSGDSHPR